MTKTHTHGLMFFVAVFCVFCVFFFAGFVGLGGRWLGRGRFDKAMTPISPSPSFLFLPTKTKKKEKRKNKKEKKGWVVCVGCVWDFVWVGEGTKQGSRPHDACVRCVGPLFLSFLCCVVCCVVCLLAWPSTPTVNDDDVLCSFSSFSLLSVLSFLFLLALPLCCCLCCLILFVYLIAAFDGMEWNGG